MAFEVYRHSTSNEAYRDPNLVKTHAGNVIGLLHAASSCLNAGTLCENDDWRIDNQNSSETIYNLQVQRNGVWHEKSSIGGVIVAKTLIAAIGRRAGTAVNPAAKTARDVELARALQAALTNSVGSWRVGGTINNRIYSFDFYSVRGDFSS